MEDRPKSARRLKLEAELRENLKRRKEQARGRSAPAEDAPAAEREAAGRGGETGGNA